MIFRKIYNRLINGKKNLLEFKIGNFIVIDKHLLDKYKLFKHRHLDSNKVEKLNKMKEIVVKHS